MKKLLGTIMAGGLVLALASPSHAQLNVQFGRGGTPTMSFGQPAYGAYPYAAGQPTYGPTYAQPSYYQQPGVYAPRTYSSGYSGYYAPAPGYRQGYYPSAYAAPAYGAPYRQQFAYPNGYSPAPATGSGLMINGRVYSLPR